MRINDITAIAVKDKYEILKASDLLETVNIKIFTSVESKERFLLLKQEQDKSLFLVKDIHGWCIQENFSSDTISIEELEDIISKNGTLFEFKEFIDDIQSELNELKKGFSIIEETLNKTS